MSPYGTIAAIANILELTIWQLAIQLQFKNCAFLQYLFVKVHK